MMGIERLKRSNRSYGFEKCRCSCANTSQYLQPTPKHLPVAEFVHPDTFKELEEIGLEKGFMYVESGPLGGLHITQKSM